ncbi:trace amine-associated receptor 13c-like [Patiria miniata]|uniref:G-protein coupled receptors family 1 profile domain-containing protein n=1 Tax=Patiria miniata TaxID=46514 RepID=A0A914ACZ1_PATMI|nr:trace amine-associated receptor 13c-like [Patiria miniata]
MICLYSRLIQISRRHERRARANDPYGANNIQDNKALKVFLLVTLTFAGCHTPFFVWKTVEGITGNAIPHWLEFAFAWLPVSNSAFNVFIYCLFHRVYRETAKKILAERFPCFKGSVAPVNI